MKKYIIRHSDFYNRFDIAWIASTTTIPHGWEQITKREAIKLCVQVRTWERNKTCTAYAREMILPYYAYDWYVDEYSSIERFLTMLQPKDDFPISHEFTSKDGYIFEECF